jgi:hypothetical protein
MTGKAVPSAPVTVRFVPANGLAKSTTILGRTYSCAANSFVDAMFQDADGLGANGWIRVAGSGTTAQRPTSPNNGQLYHDTTLNMIIVFEGTAWRRPDTMAVV